MEQYIGRRKFKIYALDIETHNDEESIKKKESSCWLGCLIDETSSQSDPESYFYSIDELLDKLEALSSPKRKSASESRKVKNLCIYIYNLSFEWSFILPKLLERGFEFSEGITKDSEFCYNSVSTKSCSSVWLVNLKFNKNSGHIMLKDLAKIYGGGLAKVAASFGLETQKETDFNYRLNRLHGHIVTDAERQYCFKDTHIIVEILLKMQERNDKNFFNSASMASYAMKDLLSFGYRGKFKPYREYRKEYPFLGEEESNFLREGVSGGITYAPDTFQFKEIRSKIGHIDAHSMHPSQAYKHAMPYGYGTYFKGAPPYPMTTISACRIRISYAGVVLHSVIELIGIDFIEDYELVVWDFEIPTMMKCYKNLEIEFIEGYYYKKKKVAWKSFYSHHYLSRLKAKKEGDEFSKLYHKLIINSSYGKHLEKPHNKITKNVINYLGIIDSVEYDKPREEWDINAKYTYLPLGSAIPARSRVDLIEHALLLGAENIVYFDTDSIFFIITPESWAVWESDAFNKEDFLGGWALEEIVDRAQFTAPKRYKLEVDGVLIVKAAGINFEETYTFEEINIVSSSWKVRRAFRCKGGTLIDFQNKEMQVQDKYKGTYQRNVEHVSGLDLLTDDPF